MRVLILEDNPERQEVFRHLFQGCVVVSNYVEAVSALHGPRYDEVWLDFDIEFGHNGADVAFDMARMPVEKWPGRVIVHSSNRAGSLAIYMTLKRVGMTVEQRPYPPTLAADSGTT